MKSQQARHAAILQLLTHIHTLRQDTLFFAKLLLLQTDRKTRNRHFAELTHLEELRNKQENSIIANVTNIELNESWKGQLFAFANRLQKVYKHFYHKLVTVSSKIAELNDNLTFVHQFRSQCIQKLAVSVSVGHFLEWMTVCFREQYQKDIIFYTNCPNKVVQQVKYQESNKNNRYLPILKQQGPALFLECHHKALTKIGLDLTKIMKEGRQIEANPSEAYSYLMDLTEQTIDHNVFHYQNGMTMKCGYLEEGISDFILNKYQRILKQLKQRNQDNQKRIVKFVDKYQAFGNRKNKNQNTKTQQKMYICPKKEESIDEFGGKSVQMRNVSIFFDNKSSTEQPEKTEQEIGSKEDKRMSLFKINKLSSRKRSYTLKPLGESKENKQVVQQKVIEMKLVQATPQTIKNMRIRRRRALPVLRDQNSLSVLMRSTNPGKLAVFIG